MVHLQEFFAAGGTQDSIAAVLEACGFSRVTSWKTPTYEADGVFVNIQPIRRPNHIASLTPHDNGFVMELSQPLDQYSREHPLFVLFQKLQDPRACGMTDLQSWYTIDDYLNPHQSAATR